MTKSILIDIAVAQRLKSARIRLNLSIKHISEATGFSYGMIYFSESGRNSVSTAYLSYLSSLGINVDWILTGEGHMFSRKEEETGKERPLTLLSGHSPEELPGVDGSPTGRRIVRVVPSPHREATSIHPPWRRTMVREEDNPSPLPPLLVVK